MKLFKNFRAYENLHIALWLLKDCFWVMMWRLPGVIMIVPTLFVALHITWKYRKEMHELFHNIAVCLWICANATWMVGEFYMHDSLRDYAKIFFLTGMAVMVYYYTMIFKSGKKSVDSFHQE